MVKFAPTLTPETPSADAVHALVYFVAVFSDWFAPNSDLIG
jgi:hypothetical protein